MLFLTVTSVFLVLVAAFFFGFSSLLLSLVTLELTTFVLLWEATLLSSPLGVSLLMLMFCLFVLESVLGLVALINLIHFTGSDFVNPSSLVLCSWVMNLLGLRTLISSLDPWQLLCYF